MGKKKNKKFKNKQISESESLDTSKKPIQETESDAPIENREKEEKYAYVQKDIKKIILLLLLSVTVLIGFYIVGSKTNTLNQFGDWVYKLMNISN